uniref:Transposase-associated domain-containing protein n=1 Tax=Setaria italica TaxID=4555 RepID=K3YKT1_SETIT
MDHRTCMYGIRRHSHTFMSEVSKFVDAAKKHARICKTKQICCPCFDCSNNIVWEDIDVMKRYLIKRGFVDGYTIWFHHGGAGGTFNSSDIDTSCDEVGDQNGDQTDACVEPQVDEECDVDMEDMLRHIEPKVLLESAKGLENFKMLKKAAKDCMYVGCGKEWTVLRFILHLLI